MIVILFIVMVTMMILRALVRDHTARTLLLIAALAAAAMICWVLFIPVGI